MGGFSKIAFKEGYSEKFHFAYYKLPKQKETTPKALSRESFEKIRDFEIPENRRKQEEWMVCNYEVEKLQATLF